MKTTGNINLYVALNIFMVLVVSTELQCFFNKSLSNKTELILSERQVITTTIYDFNLIVDKKDQIISKSIRLYGTSHPQNIKTFARFVNKGNNILIVGSHVGLEAVLFGKITGPSGKLFAVQPYEISYKILQKNILINDLQGYTTLYKMALANKQCIAHLLVNSEDTGSSKVQMEGINVSIPILKEQYIINVTLADNLIPKEVSLDFALIDAQRLELQVLQGMMGIFERSKNLITVIKWPSFSLNLKKDEFFRKSEQLMRKISQSGFKFYRIDREQYFIPTWDCEHQKFIEIKTWDIYMLLSTDKQISHLLIVPKKINLNLVV